MKLFTSAIDKQLFSQYSKGNDLSSQKVVAKIFNPYGRGTWYLINSDPSDPDYIWAIVDLFEVEVGSVSRSELENVKVPPFRLPLERDLSFTPMNAEELLNGLMQGNRYAKGGVTKYQNDIEVLEASDGSNFLFPESNDPSNVGILLADGGMMAHGGEIKWQDAYRGDSALVIAENKLGVIVKPYGRKFHLMFPDGSEKTYDASELKFIKDEDEYAKGGKTASEDVVYIQYRNAKKGFSIDKKYFRGEDAYKEAVKWGRKNIDNFNIDMVKFEMAMGGKLDVGRYYKTKDGRQVRYLGNTKDPELGTFMNKADGVFKVRYDEIEGNAYLFAEGGEMKKGGITGDLHSLTDELLAQKIKIFIDKIKPIKYYYIDEDSNSLIIGLDENYTQDAGDKLYKEATSSMEFFDADSVDMRYIPHKKQTEYSIKLKKVAKFAEGGELGVTYFIGKPEVDKVGRFGKKRASWKTCLVNERGEKNYSEYTTSFVGSLSDVKLDGIKISQSEFDKLNFDKKMAIGGEMEEGVDLFEDYENIPAKVQKVLDENSVAFEDGDYRDLEKAVKELEKIGYTFEYDLDGQAYDLREIGQKGKSEVGDDEYAEGGQVGGLTADEAIYLYVKKALVQKAREKYLKPAGLWNTPKMKEVEQSLVKKGYLNGAGAINETGKNKAREVDASVDRFISREYISSFNTKATYLELLEKFQGNDKMGKGGEVKFADKVKSIKKSLLHRKKVSPKVQKDYGKTYSPKEAEESAKRIVGAMRKKMMGESK